MTSRIEQAMPFKTPERKRVLETASKTYSTSANEYHIETPKFTINSRNEQKNSSNTYSPQTDYRGNKNLGQILKDYQSKLRILEDYLNRNESIDKKTIRQILQFPGSSDRQSEEKQVLRTLSSKVKGLIKENNDLKKEISSNSSNDLELLKEENRKLYGMLDQLERGENVRESMLHQENKYLRDYISKKDQENQLKKSNQNQKKFSTLSNNSDKSFIKKLDAEDSEKNNINSFNSPEIRKQQNVEQLKNYFKELIFTIDERNEGEFEKLQDKIKQLENKLKIVEGELEIKMKHLNFERNVILQNSMQKSKIRAENIQKMQGDNDGEEIYQLAEFEPTINEINANKANIITKRLFNESSNATTIKQQPKIIARVEQEEMERQIKAKYDDWFHKKQISMQSELETLQNKYKAQIQNQIKEGAIKENIQYERQKLTIENRSLKARLAEMEGSQKTIKRSTISSLNQEFPEEVKSIRENLLSCNLSNFVHFETEIQEIISSRDQLVNLVKILKLQTVDKNQMYNLEQKLQLERLKVENLEENCRSYEKKIENYQRIIKQIKEQSDNRQAENIKIEIDTFDAKKKSEFEGLQWQKIVENCVLTSVNRLQNLEKIMRRSQLIKDSK